MIFFNVNRLNVSNIIDPNDLNFFNEYYGKFYDKIVYYEYERPLCSNCENSMNSNGSKTSKQNKWKRTHKKQYSCPVCGKTHYTNLENFIKRYFPIIYAPFVKKPSNMNLLIIYIIKRR